jgi:hypothetical protein
MSSTSRCNRGRFPKAVLALTLTMAATGMGATSASAATVESGSLDWTLANTFMVSGMFTVGSPAYNPTAPDTGGLVAYDATRNRTWLGHVTSNAFPSPQSANGTVTPLAPATGPTVNAASARGPMALNTFKFSGASGSYDEETGVGTIALTGGIEATSPADRQNFRITLVDPVLELDGNSGKLYAHGVTGTAGTISYDDTCVTVTASGPSTCEAPHACATTPDDCPVMTLDLSQATVSRKADGTRVIGPIAPAMARADWMGGYAVGAGPERMPNTFGSFSIALDLEAAPLATGPVGPAGVAGPIGPAGAEGKTIVRHTVIGYLAKAPFGKGLRKVRVLKNGKVVARGTVRGRTVRVKLVKGAAKRLKGKYRLRVVGGKRQAVVRLG